MQIILKGCKKDVIDDISEQLGSKIILNFECTDVIDEPLFQIELDAAKCVLRAFSVQLHIMRTDTMFIREMTIADFRFEEVIIK